MRSVSSRPGSKPPFSVAPRSADAEESVIGALLRSAEVADQVFDRLDTADFYIPAHRTIFAAIRRLYDAGQPIDAVTVVDRLYRSGELESAGGTGFVVGFWDKVPSAANVDYYTALVEEHSLRRRMIYAARQITEIATDLEVEVGEVVDRAERTVLAVGERRAGDGLEPLRGRIPEVLQRVKAEGLDGARLPTGLADLDRGLQGGLRGPNLVVVAGRPAMGKSTLAMNIAAHVATHRGPVAYYSLEMSTDEIAERWLAAEARIDLVLIQTGFSTGGPNPRMWARLEEAASRLDRVPLHIDERSRSVAEVRSGCRRLKRGEGLCLVVVDYLQIMGHPRGRDSRQQEVAEISRDLKALAKELAVPLIAVSQLNRALEIRPDKRPQLPDLRESGAIEQDADVVLMIYRDDYYNPDTTNRGIAEIRIAKQRAGPTGMVKARFTGEYTRFDNLHLSGTALLRG